MTSFKFSNQLRQNKSLAFLISLILLILIFPFFEGSKIGAICFILLYTTVLLAGIYAISDDVRYIAIGILLVAPILVCQWSNLILNHPTLALLQRICSAIFMIYTIVALLKHILTAKRVGTNEIYGAICAYVLLGTVFGIFYFLIETLSPGSFHFDHDAGPVRPITTFIYFSFTALSTVGFGDIVAVAPFARSLAVVEMIIGVTYVAVLIGRLLNARHLHPKDEEEMRTAKHLREKAFQQLLRQPSPLKERPIGLITATLLLNLVTSILMYNFHLPFFLDSWGTSLAVILGGLIPGIITALLYNFLMAALVWGWSSWIWVFCSFLVALVTWFFSKRHWINLYKPFHLIFAGIMMGFLNGALAQFIIFAANLPPYQGTLPVYDFFLKTTSHQGFAALAEKMFVEVADKTLALILAAVAALLLRDCLKTFEQKLSNQSPSKT